MDEKEPTRPQPRRLLDEVRLALRRGHYSPRTEEVYVHWIIQYIRFHGRRHPRELGHEHLMEFLNHLANERNLAASSQNQALNAIVFLYRQVLGIELQGSGTFEHARRPRHLPTVLCHEETKVVLGQMLPRLRAHGRSSLWQWSQVE